MMSCLLFVKPIHAFQAPPYCLTLQGDMLLHDSMNSSCTLGSCSYDVALAGFNHISVAP